MLHIKKIGLFIILIAQTAWTEPRLVVSEGVLFMKGSLSLDYGVTNFNNAQHSLQLRSTLGGGFFLADHLSVGISVPFELGFMGTRDRQLGISLNTDYYFDLGTIVFPYIGLDITPSYNFYKKAALLSLQGSAGFLVSLSEMVAIDIGLAPRFYIPLSEHQRWSFQLPAGFLGVRAFF